MKNETVAIKEFVGLKPNCIHSQQMIIVSTKKQKKGVNKNVVEKIKMNRIHSKNLMLELMKSTKFICLVLMIKCTF